jgi:hypothetical protein
MQNTISSARCSPERAENRIFIRAEFLERSTKSRYLGPCVKDGQVIRFSFKKIAKFDIARPTLLEIAGLGMVLCFLALLILLWR